MEGLSSFKIEMSVMLAREGDCLWGTISNIDCPILNAACEKWVVQWLRDTL